MVTGDLKEAWASDLQKLAADLSETENDDVDRIRHHAMRRVPSSRRADFQPACSEGHSAKSCGITKSISENFLHLNQAIPVQKCKDQTDSWVPRNSSIRHPLDIRGECLLDFFSCSYMTHTRKATKHTIPGRTSKAVRPPLLSAELSRNDFDPTLSEVEKIVKILGFQTLEGDPCPMSR